MPPAKKVRSVSDTPASVEKKKKSKAAPKGWVHEILHTFVYPVLLVVGVYTFLFQPFRIPSASMVDTLLIGDFVWVEKYAYGYSRHSFFFSPNLFEGRLWGAEPKQGDVAVFKVPTDNTTDFIKRVIGLPGDRIQMKQGRLFINGQECPREFVEDVELEYYDPSQRGPNHMTKLKTKRYVETLPNGTKHNILEISDDYDLDNTVEFVVPEGHYFMMGDDRDNSADSRVWKYVPLVNFVGRAERIFPSWDAAKAEWYTPWNWPFAFRWDRTFKSID